MDRSGAGPSCCDDTDEWALFSHVHTNTHERDRNVKGLSGSPHTQTDHNHGLKRSHITEQSLEIYSNARFKTWLGLVQISSNE